MFPNLGLVANQVLLPSPASGPLQEPLLGEQSARGGGVALQHRLQGFERPALAGFGMARAIDQGVVAAVEFGLDDEAVESRAGLEPARQRQVVGLGERGVGLAHRDDMRHQGAGIILPAARMGCRHQGIGGTLRRVVQRQ